MNVTEAVESRTSCRGFLPAPVPEATLRSILEAARTNTVGRQPAALARVCAHRRTAGRTAGCRARQAVRASPRRRFRNTRSTRPGLGEPYRSRRFKCGEDLYAAIRVAREDKPARLRRFAQHYSTVRRTCRAVLFHRPADGTAAMVRPRHVHADRDAACPRAWSRQLRPGIVVGLVSNRRRMPAGAPGTRAVLRHGAWLPRRPGPDQSLPHRAREPRGNCRAARILSPGGRGPPFSGSFLRYVSNDTSTARTVT